MPITERELRKAYGPHTDRISFTSAGAKTPQAIRHELRALFDAGLSWDEARAMVIPIGHNMKAAFFAEWKDWDQEKIIAEVRALVSKHLFAEWKDWDQEKIIAEVRALVSKHLCGNG